MTASKTNITTTAATKKISNIELGIEKLMKVYGRANLQFKRGEDILSIFNVQYFDSPLVDMYACTDGASIGIKIPVTKLDEMIKQKKIKVLVILPESIPVELPIVIYDWFMKNKRKPSMLKKVEDLMALRLVPGVGFKNINAAIDWLQYRYPS